MLKGRIVQRSLNSFWNKIRANTDSSHKSPAFQFSRPSYSQFQNSHRCILNHNSPANRHCLWSPRPTSVKGSCSKCLAHRRRAQQPNIDSCDTYAKETKCKSNSARLFLSTQRNAFCLAFTWISVCIPRSGSWNWIVDNRASTWPHFKIIDCRTHQMSLHIN